MLYSQNIESCFDTALSPGARKTAYDKHLVAAGEMLKTMGQHQKTGPWPFLALPQKRDDLRPVKEIARQLQDHCSDIVILGTGASNLGGRTLCALANITQSAPRRPRLWFIDTIDPEHFLSILARLPPRETGILVISKSGNTTETLCQFLAIRDWMTHHNQSGWKKRCVAICDPGPRYLRQWGEEIGMTILDHDPHLGGRYSALSATGLLPAALAGLSIENFRHGAATMMPEALRQETSECLPAQGAALIATLQDTSLQNPIRIYVLMSYCDRLSDFTLWHRQLWAESLGKAGQGLTPAPARGPVDQHSQLQLYLDGPNDKFFTFITRDPGPQSPIMPQGDTIPPYLAGKDMAEILNAHWQATQASLIRKHRPLRHITLKTLDEATLGALLMQFMLETVLTAHMMGVNPFDQPAVEDSKKQALAYLEANSQSAKRQL